MAELSIVVDEATTETNNGTSSSNTSFQSTSFAELFDDRLHPLPHGSRQPPRVCVMVTAGFGSDEYSSRYAIPALQSLTDSIPRGLHRPFGEGVVSGTISDDPNVVLTRAFISNNQRSASNDGSRYVSPPPSPNMDDLIPHSFGQQTYAEDVLTPGLGSRTISDDPNVVLTRALITSSQRFASNDGSRYVATPSPNINDSIPHSLGQQTYGEDVFTPGLESVIILNDRNVVITTNRMFACQSFIDPILCLLPLNFRRRLSGQNAERQRLELAIFFENQNVFVDQAAITNNMGFFDLLLSRLPSSFLRPTFREDEVRLFELPTVMNDPNFVVTNNQRSFMRNVYQLLGSTMNAESAVSLIIIALLAFIEIKSQGEPTFPFQTHSRIIMVAINSVVLYALSFAAERIINVSGLGPDSVYASVARVGRRLCLCVLVGSLASLFYF